MNEKYNVSCVNSTGETLDEYFYLSVTIYNFEYEKKFAFIRTEQQMIKFLINGQNKFNYLIHYCRD